MLRQVGGGEERNTLLKDLTVPVYRALLSIRRLLDKTHQTRPMRSVGRLHVSACALGCEQ